MTTPEPQEDPGLIAKRAAIAKDADGDTEDRLVQLESLQTRRRADPELEARYERLRNDVARQLGDEGARWFLDDDGNKRLAFVVRPETTVLDVQTAIELHAEGLISSEMLDMIAPRKQSLEGIRRAVTAKEGSPSRLSAKQVRQLLRFNPGTPYVRFADPEGEERP